MRMKHDAGWFLFWLEETADGRWDASAQKNEQEYPYDSDVLTTACGPTPHEALAAVIAQALAYDDGLCPHGYHEDEIEDCDACTDAAKSDETDRETAHPATTGDAATDDAAPVVGRLAAPGANTGGTV
jgi:hypothetical protein